MDLCNLEEVPRLRSTRNLDEVNLASNNFPFIRSNSFTGLDKMKHLSLAYCDIRRIEESTFRDLGSLRVSNKQMWSSAAQRIALILCSTCRREKCGSGLISVCPCDFSVNYSLSHFTPAFGECPVGASQGGFETRDGFQQSLIVLLAPHQRTTKAGPK